MPAEQALALAALALAALAALALAALAVIALARSCVDIQTAACACGCRFHGLAIVRDAMASSALAAAPVAEPAASSLSAAVAVAGALPEARKSIAFAASAAVPGACDVPCGFS